MSAAEIQLAEQRLADLFTEAARLRERLERAERQLEKTKEFRQ